MQVLCIELPVVETAAAGEQLSDTQSQHVTGQFIIRSLQLCIDIVEAIDDDPSFAIKKFQSLSHFVFKEIEHIKVTSQSCAIELFRPESEHPAMRFYPTVQIHRYHISRFHGEHGSSPVSHAGIMQNQFSEIHFHQYYTIHAEVGRLE